MKHLIRLTNYKKEDIYNIFSIADELADGRHADILKGKSVVMFFPNSSIRTRVTFEKGIYSLGGYPVSYTHQTLPTNVSRCCSRWGPVD